MESTTQTTTAPVSAPAAPSRPSDQMEAAIRAMDYDGQMQVLLNYVERPKQFYWLTTYHAAAQIADAEERSRKKAAVVLALWTTL